MSQRPDPKEPWETEDGSEYETGVRIVDGGDAVRLVFIAHYETAEIGIERTRAADDVRVEFDFERNGWSIQRPINRMEGGNMEEIESWREVFFTPAFVMVDERP